MVELSGGCQVVTGTGDQYGAAVQIEALRPCDQCELRMDASCRIEANRGADLVVKGNVGVHGVESNQEQQAAATASSSGQQQQQPTASSRVSRTGPVAQRGRRGGALMGTGGSTPPRPPAPAARSRAGWPRLSFDTTQLELPGSALVVTTARKPSTWKPLLCGIAKVTWALVVPCIVSERTAGSGASALVQTVTWSLGPVNCNSFARTSNV